MSDDKNDITRLEDISAFTHDDEESVDLDTFSDEEPEAEEEEVSSDFESDSFEEEGDSFSDDSDEDAFSDEGDSSNDFSDDDNAFASDDQNDAFQSDDNDFTEQESETFQEEDSAFGKDQDDAFATDDAFGEEESFDSSEGEFASNDDSFEEESFLDEDNDENALEAGPEEILDQKEEELEDTFNEEDSVEAQEDDPSEPEPPVEEPVKEEKTEEIVPLEVKEEKTPAQPVPQKSPSPIQEVANFSANINAGAIGHGGNPPYSILIRNIRFEEDAEDIKILLREVGLLTQENDKDISKSLETGNLLLSQISEFAAIFLAHKLRRFSGDLSMGLSEEIHQSKNYDDNPRGLVSKYSLFQNKKEAYTPPPHDFKAEDIIVSTLPYLDNAKVKHVHGVVSDHKVLTKEEIESYDFKTAKSLDHAILGGQQFIEQDHIKLETIYSVLAENLRPKAYKLGANAVLGLQYQFTPLGVSEGGSHKERFKISCIGNAVSIEN